MENVHFEKENDNINMLLLREHMIDDGPPPLVYEPSNDRCSLDLEDMINDED